LAPGEVFKSPNPIYAVKMAKEFELKAHIANYGAMKDLLEKKANFLWEFEKKDAYWTLVNSPMFPGPQFRLRREKLTFPDKSEKSTCLATYKTKEKMDGMEINNEKEFEVIPASGQSENAFEEFLQAAGLKKGISKVKRGWAFSREDIKAELCEIESLGWFIELEILVDDDTPDTGDSVRENRDRLLKFLDSLGVEREAIESRFYLEMLALARTL